MRLNIRKINDYSYYSIIKDYTNLDGKRTNITDDLHDLFKFNTDLEIVSYKKMKKIFNTKN